MGFSENSLASSRSPYLRQHADNPVWWHEWNEKTLAHARETGKPMLVSVGYSTCHWCHVMAADAFSNPECAAYLNEHFISIKVDREQRPDIDHYLMTFLVATTGSGGWPLNAFLTPEGNPFFAMTYAASEPRFNIPGFAEILSRVREFYEERRGEIERFELPDEQSRINAGLNGAAGDEPFVVPIRDEDQTDVEAVIEKLTTQFDDAYAGFGTTAKFPPHAPLLFLQHAHAAGLEKNSEALIQRTLDVMQRRGLHDHLQGGFFRYTVDRTWTIPHFEKMLYDQALLLWNYSVASRLFSREDYRRTAAGILRCLEETFRIDALYASGHDADTHHEEGATYLWSTDELEKLLSPESRTALHASFELSENGNFEGSNHLVLRDDAPTVSPDVLDTLLEARRKRRQPDRDDKIVVSWNALTGVSLFAADRFAGLAEAGSRAEEITRALLETYTDGSRVYHGSFEGTVDHNRFLADHAALLLLITFAREHNDTLSTELASAEQALLAGLSEFQREGSWIENVTPDFAPLPADPYDQPVPASVSMAEFALLRSSMAAHKEYQPLAFGSAQGQAFGNLTALASRGYYWVVESPERYDWAELPPNAIYVSGEHRVSCYRGVCYLGSPAAAGGKKGTAGPPQA